MGSIPGSLGSVFVDIQGDPTKLYSAFAKSQEAAVAAGSTISKSFTASVAPSREATAGAESFTVALQQLASVISQENAALALSIQRNMAHAGAQRAAATAAGEHSRALHGQVREIQAVGGTLRTALGESAIRPAERFLTMIPGIGAALQGAFFVTGAIALGEAFSRVAEKAAGLEEAEKQLKAATEETDQAFAKTTRTIDSLNIERITRDFGAVAGQKAQAAEFGAQVKDAANEIAGLRNQITLLAKDATSVASHPILLAPKFGGDFAQATADKMAAIGQRIVALQQEIQTLTAESNKKLEDSQRSAVEAAARLSGLELANQEATLKRDTELRRAAEEGAVTAAHNKRVGVIEATAGEFEVVQQIGRETVAAAQDKMTRLGRINAEELAALRSFVQQRATVESAGKTPQEQKEIGTRATGELEAAQADFAARQAKLAEEVRTAQDKADSDRVAQTRKIGLELDKQAEAAFDSIWRSGDVFRQKTDEIAARLFATLTAVNEIQAKSAGESEQLKLDREKLEAARQYGQIVLPTAQQQIALARTLEDIEQRRRAARIGTLQAELSATPDDGAAENTKKRAELEAEIAKVRGESDNAAYEAQTKLNDLTAKQTLQYKIQHDIASAARSVPGAIGQGVAAGVFQHGKGTSIGQEISQALKGIGQQLLGRVVEQMIAALFTNTAATSVNTGATLTNVGAMVSHAAIMAGHAIAIIANTIATNLNTLVTGIGHLFGGLFASGGRPPVGVPSVVGERGAELFIPDAPGTIVPHGQFAMQGSSGSIAFNAQNYAQSNSTQLLGDINFHAHGVSNPRQMAEMMAREIPNRLKVRSTSFSPLSR